MSARLLPFPKLPRQRHGLTWAFRHPLDWWIRAPSGRGISVEPAWRRPVFSVRRGITPSWTVWPVRVVHLAPPR